MQFSKGFLWQQKISFLSRLMYLGVEHNSSYSNQSGPGFPIKMVTDHVLDLLHLISGLTNFSPANSKKSEICRDSYSAHIRGLWLENFLGEVPLQQPPFVPRDESRSRKTEDNSRRKKPAPTEIRNHQGGKMLRIPSKQGPIVPAGKTRRLLCKKLTTGN